MLVSGRVNHFSSQYMFAAILKPIAFGNDINIFVYGD